MNALAAAYQRARALCCVSCARVPNGERVSCACTLPTPLHLSLCSNGKFAICLGEKAYGGGGGGVALHFASPFSD